MDVTGRCACGTYTESSSGLCAGCINRSRVYGSSVPTIVGTPFDPHNCTVPMEMADASPSQPVVTGRRRCGIPEHRRQIKYLQKWCHYVQNTQSANWHRIRAAEMEVEKLRLELREAYRLWGVASGSEVSTGHTTEATTKAPSREARSSVSPTEKMPSVMASEMPTKEQPPNGWTGADKVLWNIMLDEGWTIPEADEMVASSLGQRITKQMVWWQTEKMPSGCLGNSAGDNTGR